MSRESQKPTDRIELYLDGGLSAEEMLQFDEELQSCSLLREELRKRVHLHGLLSGYFDGEISFTESGISKEKSASSSRWLALAAALMAMAAVVSVVIPRGPEDTEVFATVTHSKGSEFSVGAEISDGAVEITEGFIEVVSGSNVSIAIQAPASFRFVASDRMELNQGALSAHVPPGSEGFTVVTDKGEVIDLGTRFGVSVSGDEVEAHVFEGEIEVNGAEQEPVLLQGDEAYVLGESRRQRSQADRFPMPAYPLEVELATGSFEENSGFLSGVPVTAAQWGGDEVALAGKEDGISPRSGERMVSFKKTFSVGEEKGGELSASELWQLVDLRAAADPVNRGGVTADLSAFFNRVSGDSTTDQKFGVGLTAFRGSIPEAPEFWDRKNNSLSERLSQSSTEILSDEDPESWDEAHCRLLVPPGTDFLMIQIFAFEDVQNDLVNEFAGHFLDDVSLELRAAPRPTDPVAVSSKAGGNWNRSESWSRQTHPDPNRESIEVEGAGELVIDSEVSLKQSLTISKPNDSEGTLRISRNGYLAKSGAGQVVIGYNENSEASLIVEGTLETSGPVFIGRNNRESTLHVKGGFWNGEASVVRMAQYGERGEDTKSALDICSGGKAQLGILEMIHDESLLRVDEGGSLEVGIFRLGGADGVARVVHGDGLIRLKSFEFGVLPIFWEFASESAVLEVEGQWTLEELRNLPRSPWRDEQNLRAEVFETPTVPWTRVTLSR